MLVAFFALPVLAAEPIKVIVASDHESWGYRYLLQALGRDATFDAAGMLLGGQEDLAEQLKSCSVLILMDMSPDNLGKRGEHMESIKEFVERGGGLIVASGESWRGQEFPIANLLPVDQRDAAKVVQNDAPQLSRPQVTGAGLRNPILRLVDDPMRNQQLWREELDAGFGEPLPVIPHQDAAVLAVDPLRRLAGKEIPLLAVRDVGDGRVLFVNNPQLWRWRRKPIGNYHGRIWIQAVRFAAGE